MKAILLCGTLLMMSVLSANIATAQNLPPKHPAHRAHHTVIAHHEIYRKAALKKHAAYIHHEPLRAYNGHGGTMKRHDGYTRDIY